MVADDTGGVMRVWPSIEPGLPPVLGRAMLVAAGEGARAMPGYEGAIRYRERALEDTPVFTQFSIETLADPPTPELLARMQAMLRQVLSRS